MKSWAEASWGGASPGAVLICIAFTVISPPDLLHAVSSSPLQAQSLCVLTSKWEKHILGPGESQRLPNGSSGRVVSPPPESGASFSSHTPFVTPLLQAFALLRSVRIGAALVFQMWSWGRCSPHRPPTERFVAFLPTVLVRPQGKHGIFITATCWMSIVRSVAKKSTCLMT